MWGEDEGRSKGEVSARVILGLIRGTIGTEPVGLWGPIEAHACKMKHASAAVTLATLKIATATTCNANLASGGRRVRRTLQTEMKRRVKRAVKGEGQRKRQKE